MAIKRAQVRSTHAFAALQGIVVGVPQLGLACLGIARRRRDRS